MRAAVAVLLLLGALSAGCAAPEEEPRGMCCPRSFSFEVWCYCTPAHSSTTSEDCRRYCEADCFPVVTPSEPY